MRTRLPPSVHAAIQPHPTTQSTHPHRVHHPPRHDQRQVGWVERGAQLGHEGQGRPAQSHVEPGLEGLGGVGEGEGLRHPRGGARPWWWGARVRGGGCVRGWGRGRVMGRGVGQAAAAAAQQRWQQQEPHSQTMASRRVAAAGGSASRARGVLVPATAHTGGRRAGARRSSLKTRTLPRTLALPPSPSPHASHTHALSRKMALWSRRRMSARPRGPHAGRW